MITHTVEEYEEILAAKKKWNKTNRGRKLFTGKSFSDIPTLIELSDFANKLIKKK